MDTTTAATATAGSKSAAALFSALRNYKASEVKGLADKGVVEIDSETTPIDAANVLWEHDILGVPVWDNKAHKYCGVFDMRDILSAVISAAARTQDKGETTTPSAEYTDIMVKSVEELHLVYKDKGVPVTTKYLASRNPFAWVTPLASLEKVCELLSDSSCRRVLICVKEGTRCTNIISRSALVKFICEHTSPQDLSETLDEAGLDYRKDVVSVKDDATAFEAFELIDSKGLSGIAVVDEDGKLVGNTSARDIKYAAKDKGRTAMNQDIISYLASLRQSQISKEGKERYPICVVNEDATVSHVVNTLVKTGYHRVFVADSNRHPVGVISVRDILQFVVEKGGKVPATGEQKLPPAEDHHAHVRFGSAS